MRRGSPVAEKSSPSARQVLAQLEAWGAESVRKIYERQGSGPNTFGVTLGKLRGYAKQLKRNHSLALELWAAGNYDAMVLASMVLDPARLSASEIESMIQALTSARLVDELTFNTIAESPHAAELRERWMKSPEALTGRAGWNLLIARFMESDSSGIDLEEVLRQVEATLLSAPLPKKDAINRALVELAVHFPDYTERCIRLGERLGRWDDRPVPKGCTSSYAPEWIAAVLRRKKAA